jgi:FkbM family methyltransferase
VKKSVLDFLSSWAGPAIVGQVASVYGRRRISGFRVYEQDGLWIHRYPGPRFTAHETIRLPRPLASGAPDMSALVHAEPASLRDILIEVANYVPKPGDVVMDIGAGKGTLTAALAHFAGPQGRVLAVEAHPIQFRCLETLCRLNGLDNVILVPAAVSDRDTELVIADGAIPDANAVSASGRGHRIRATTIDALLSTHELAVVDLLTMNIEGAEREAMRGMIGSLDRIRRVAIACHDFRADLEGDETMRTKREVTAFLEDNDFVITSRDNAGHGVAIRDWIAAENARFGSKRRAEASS